MDTASSLRSAIRLNETRRRLERARVALWDLRNCIGSVQAAGPGSPSAGLEETQKELESSWERLRVEGEVVDGACQSSLIRRTLAELPAGTLEEVLALNRRVARLEDRLGRWLLVETRVTLQPVLHGEDVHTGTWLLLPHEIDLMVRFRGAAFGAGGDLSPDKLRLRLSAVKCQFRYPGAKHPASATQAGKATPGPSCIDADPGEDSHDVCGLLRVLRRHAGLGWGGMLEMAKVTVRLMERGSQFTALL